jgi:hypothetical protein
MSAPLTVTINGVQYDPWTPAEFTYTNSMGQTIPTMSGTLYDKGGTLPIPPMAADMIVRDATGAPVWGGLLSMRTGRTEGNNRYWDIHGQGYALLLQKTLVYGSYGVAYTYTNQFGQLLAGDLAIIANLFEQCIVGPGGTQSTPSEIMVNANYCQQGTTSLSTVDFLYAYQQEVIQYFCNLVGFGYYVDPLKIIHYYYLPMNLAPFSLASTDVTSVSGRAAVPYHNLRWKEDATRLQNNFLVFGTTVTSNTQPPFYLAGDGVSATINTTPVGTNYPISGAPGTYTLPVWLNTGTQAAPVWTQLVSGVKGVDTLGQYSGGAGGVVQVLFDGANQQLIFQTAPPAFTNAVKIVYVFTYQGGQPFPDIPSQTTYNRVFSQRLIASDANSAAAMTSLVNHLDQQFANPLEVLTCNVVDTEFPSGNSNRFLVGQWLPFWNKTLGINSGYYIHSITTKVLGGQTRNYDLELRSYTLE